jgi:hypothetical protein
MHKRNKNAGQVHLKIVEGETIGLYSFQLPVLNKPIIFARVRICSISYN